MQTAVMLRIVPVLIASVLLTASGTSKAIATPRLQEAGVKKLDTPGLWLSSINWKQPHTGQGGQYTFRVYCPTAMMRDVSHGSWGEAAKLSQMEGRGYPTGVPSLAYRQACQ